MYIYFSGNSFGAFGLQCNIPSIIRGQWFSLEQGQAMSTDFTANSMSRRGFCADMVKEHKVNYTFVFHSKDTQCLYCVKILVRTVNVLDKMESEYR